MSHKHPPGGVPPRAQEVEDWPRLEESLRSLLLGTEMNSGPPPVKPFRTDLPKKEAKPKKVTGTRPPRYDQPPPGSQAKEPTGKTLRDMLLEECDKENFALLQVGSENFNEKLTYYRRPEFVTNYLKKHDVRPLKKKSEKFPKALYYCRLCDYHCDKLAICIQHIEDTRHTRLSKMQEVEITLFHLPKPTKHHLDTLEQLLYIIEEQYSLSKADMQSRLLIATRVGNILGQVIPGSTVRLYGSSLSGFGLVDADVNLDLQIPESIRQDQALIGAFNAIERDPEYKNVQHDFCAKTPVISFYVGCLKCELSLNNQHAYQTSVLLKDYFNLDPRVKTLSAALRLWAKLCCIDRQAHGTLPAHAFALLLVYFLQQGKKPVLPCIHDHLNTRDPDTYESPSEYLSTIKIRNNSSVSELWIEFFEFYSLGFNNNDEVVSIRNIGGFSRDEKQWKGKKLAIEDPFSIKRSLTRSVNNPYNLDFIADCFKIAYLYFGTVQTTKGPTVTKIIVPDSPGPDPEPESPPQKCAPSETVSKLMSQLQVGSSDSNSGSRLDVPPPSKILTLEELERSFNMDIETDDEDSAITSFETFRLKNGTELTPKQAQQVAAIVPKNMILFQFNSEIFTGGQSPIMVCNVCGAEGHLQSTCPEENLPPLKPLPPMSYEHKMMLDRVCEEVMIDFKPTLQENRDRDFIMQDLTRYIRKTFPTAKLTLYGSSRNGFGIRESDLDISLTFTDHPTDETINAIERIEVLAEKLKRMSGIGNIQAITSAKVPILKFVHYRSKIEGDISLYNILAQENTEMLLTYSKIDARLKILGYIVKCYVKFCDIGDASKGSLSSYAYILLLIYYLQQCSPPVLPVLQEFYPGSEKPVFMVDGWNAWFFRDLERIQQNWPGFRRNQKSVAELWIGFLEFYASGFDDRNLIVSIRQFRPLTKFSKMWNSPCLAIEDPFDLDHNLGAGLSRKMNLFIKKAFRKSRDHFGTPLPLTKSPLELKAYLFNPDGLCDGLPPNDRGCRACGKIGHLVRDCPRKKQSDERKKRERMQKNDSRTRTQSEREVDNKRQPKKTNGEEPSTSTSPPSPPKAVEKPRADTTPNSSSVKEPEPNIDTHFMSLLEGLRVGGSSSQDDDPGVNPEAPQPPMAKPPPLPTMNQAINVEDLEKSFVSPPNSPTGLESDQKPVAPPPGFHSAPAPIGPRIPAPVGHRPHSAFQPLPPGLPPQLQNNHLGMLLGLQNHPGQNTSSPLGLLHQHIPSSSPQPIMSSPQFGMHAHSIQPPNLGLSPHLPSPGSNLFNPFGPFDPLRNAFCGPMMGVPAFNPFNSFGPIMPGQPSSLMMQTLSGPPKLDPNQRGSPVGLNTMPNMSLPQSAKGPNCYFPERPFLPPSTNSFGLSFGPDPVPLSRPPDASFQDFIGRSAFGQDSPNVQPYPEPGPPNIFDPLGNFRDLS